MSEQGDEGNDRIDEDAIARRAHEIHESGEGGTPEENWLRAEEELRGSRRGGEPPHS